MDMTNQFAMVEASENGYLLTRYTNVSSSPVGYKFVRTYVASVNCPASVEKRRLASCFARSHACASLVFWLDIH